MSLAMATKINMKKSITLGTNANIQFIVKEGQKIKTGQPLVVFENEFDDSSINDILDKLGSEFQQEIQEMTNKIVKSKYTGTITKINMYYNRDLEEFSPSIQKILKQYINKHSKKAKIVDEIRKSKDSNISLNVNVPIIEKMNNAKINGEEVDGILIEIYTEYNDELGIGDKINI